MKNIVCVLFFLLVCSLSVHAVAVTLDFEGANFQDSFTRSNAPPGEIRWNNIARLSGVSGEAGRIDLVATVSSGSTYNFGTVPPRNTNGPSTNPAVPAGATLLKVEVGTNVSFDFNFFTGTGESVAVTTDISFLDFDQTDRTSSGQGIVSENLTFLGLNSSDVSTYTYATANDLSINTSNPSQPIFSSVQEGSASDNPTDLSNLSVAEQQKIVEFNLVEVTGFTLNMAVGGTTPDNDARSFFIAGDIDFTVPTTTVTIPEPSSAAIFALAAIFLSLRRDRSRDHL